MNKYYKQFLQSNKKILDNKIYNTNIIISDRGRFEFSLIYAILGSALCNNYITTDFSEAQTELVTPPFNDKIQGLKFLEDIHHFVSCNIKDEILWPFSTPPTIDDEKDIPIANYGSSNLGLFKRRYRNGLSVRYGRLMQTISGIHYNYSVPEPIWESSLFKDANFI